MRHWNLLPRWGALLAVLALLGCTPKDKPAFHATDITGGDHAQTLVAKDPSGKERSLAEFHGKVVTLFFGYTQCPDVCPTNLTTMAEVMNKLGADAEKVQVIFMTVDPERDTPELLQQYVPAFNPAFLGLYATPEQTAAIAKGFKVFYQKQGDVKGAHYTIDHSAGTYVFDPQGRLRLYMKHGEKAEHVVSDIRLLLAGK